MAAPPSVQRVSFFTRQDHARRQTVLLVFLLMVAVALIVLALNVAVYLALVYTDEIEAGARAWLEEPWPWAITIVTVVAILTASLARLRRLRSGGTAVAEMVGGRPVDLAAWIPSEKRLINVVEEMAIASGIPVPRLYILDDEHGINAFVAGYKPTEAVMVVTRGALEKLERNELQGLVAHEFSHILNGDMRLNIRLMAILAGITIIGTTGRVMLNPSRKARGSSRVRGSSRSGGAKGPGQFLVIYMAIALSLLIIGYIGLFFGRIIKAAVSRQREFLADASSVQFTRDPDGIGGVLWQLRRSRKASLLQSGHAEDVSHMCFGPSIGTWALLATHPPIEVRLDRVNPGYVGRRAAAEIRKRRGSEEKPAEGAATWERKPQPSPGPLMGFSGSAPVALATTAGAVVQSIGNPTPAHVEYAAAVRRRIPEPVLKAVHDPWAACQIVYALLMSDVKQQVLKIALALVAHREGRDAAQAVNHLAGLLSPLGDAYRLPLFDLAIPALKRLPAEASTRFVDTAGKLIEVDRNVTLFEFVLLTLLRKQLSPDAERADRVRYLKIKPVLLEVRLLLSMVARAGAETDDEARQSLEVAAAGFGWIHLADAPECEPSSMYPVLKKLAQLTPFLKQSLLHACTDCVLHDGKVRPAEAELLRAISASLECPMPPLIPTNVSEAGP